LDFRSEASHDGRFIMNGGNVTVGDIIHDLRNCLHAIASGLVVLESARLDSASQANRE
jgi:hypothetical protein